MLLGVGGRVEAGLHPRCTFHIHQHGDKLDLCLSRGEASVWCSRRDKDGIDVAWSHRFLEIDTNGLTFLHPIVAVEVLYVSVHTFLQ